MKISKRVVMVAVVLSGAFFAFGMKAGEMKVRWLQSVVTEAWVQTGTSSWETTMPPIYGQVGDAFTVIGLREDGVVVWKTRDDIAE